MLRLLVLAALVVLEVSGQVIRQGRCPDLSPVPELDLDKYMGTWYEQIHSRRWTGLELKCSLEYFDTSQPSSFRINSFTYSPVANRTFHIRGEAEFKSTKSSMGTLKVKIPSMNIDGEVLIIGTDYSSYTVMWSCVNVEKLHFENVVVMTRERLPKGITISQAVTVLVKHRIQRSHLQYTTHRDCPPIDPAALSRAHHHGSKHPGMKHHKAHHEHSHVEHEGHMENYEEHHSHHEHHQSQVPTHNEHHEKIILEHKENHKEHQQSIKTDEHNTKQEHELKEQKIKISEPIHGEKQEKSELAKNEHEEKKKPIHKENEEKKEPAHKKNEEKKEPIHKENEKKKEPAHKENEEKKEPTHKENEEKKEPIHKENEEKKEAIHKENGEKKEPAHKENEEKKEPTHKEHEGRKEPAHKEENKEHGDKAETMKQPERISEHHEGHLEEKVHILKAGAHPSSGAPEHTKKTKAEDLKHKVASSKKPQEEHVEDEPAAGRAMTQHDLTQLEAAHEASGISGSVIATGSASSALTPAKLHKM